MKVSGKYYRKGKTRCISYRKGSKEISFEIDSKTLQHVNFFIKNQLSIENQSIEVEFDMKNAGAPSAAPDFKSVELKSVEPNITSSSSGGRTTVLTLPSPFECFQPRFQALGGQGELTRETMQQIILEYISRKKTLKRSDVSMMLRAAEQNFPLAFRSKEQFEKTFISLIKIEDKGKWLTTFSYLAEEMPLCILVHGSSVGGLRGKGKSGKGWSFDKDSDLDVSIVDYNRFCWAQALGITTYSQNNTIELEDTQINLLRLSKFVQQFRIAVVNTKVGDNKSRRVNFCVYKDEESARQHSDFSLVCTFDQGARTFTIEKTYTPFNEKKSPIDEKPISLYVFLRQEYKFQPRREKMATSEIIAEKKLKDIPTQGNHVFNDVHACILRHIANLRDLAANATNYSVRFGHDFVQGYIMLLGGLMRDVALTSRDDGIASEIHQQNKSKIQTGLDIPSNGVNDLLFGNAWTYFENCSVLLCEVALISLGGRRQVSVLLPPLKKAFGNVLNNAIDQQLIGGIKIKKEYGYVLSQITKYQEICEAVNTSFKMRLLSLSNALPEERDFIDEVFNSPSIPLPVALNSISAAASSADPKTN